MKPTCILAVFALLIFSCAPLQPGAPAKSQLPSLGVLGKKEASLLKNNFQEIGKPQMTRALPLAFKEVVFTKTSFKKYLNSSKSQGKKPGLTYVDSLPKPTYMHLQIADKIALQSTLNASENSEVRSYICKDDKYGVVTAISILLDTPLKNKILASEALFLTEGPNGQMAIALMNNKETNTVQLPEGRIFDYEFSGFCWGADRYSQKVVEAIAIDGEACPKGTEAKAYKLDETKPYLKLN